MIASACSPASEKPAPTIVRYVRPTAPPASRVPCHVSDLPDRAMTETEITPKWGADRKEIISCDARRAAAVAAIDGSPPLETGP